VLRTGRLQCVPELGKLLPHLLPPSRQHEVRQPELVDAASLPGVPGGVGVLRRWGPGRVALEDDHLMRIASQQHRGGQAAEARAEDQDPCHVAPPSMNR
jgi:hypothetical protein